MSFWSQIHDFDRKYPSSSIGTAIGLVIGLFGIWIALFYEKHPQLRYEVISQAPVYSIRENVSDLEIIFKGENIKQKHESLSVIALRVSNPGSAHIELGSFDLHDLPGFEVTEGKIIIEPEIIHTTNPYLKKTLHLAELNDHAYTISPVILERDQSFTVKLLVLSPETANPQVRSFGKIAGVAKIDLTTMPPNEEHRSFLWRTFSGDTVVQVVRALAYTVAFLALIITLTISISKLSSAISRRHRRRLVRKFRRLLGHEATQKESAVFERYVEVGESIIVQLNETFADRESLGKRVREYLKLVDPDQPKKPEQTELLYSSFPGRSRAYPGLRFTPMLVEQKIVFLEADRIVVDEQAADTVSRFESFLMANDPDKVKTAKAYGSDAHPVDNVAALPATKRPENE